MYPLEYYLWLYNCCPLAVEYLMFITHVSTSTSLVVLTNVLSISNVWIFMYSITRIRYLFTTLTSSRLYWCDWLSVLAHFIWTIGAYWIVVAGNSVSPTFIPRRTKEAIWKACRYRWYRYTRITRKYRSFNCKQVIEIRTQCLP